MFDRSECIPSWDSLLNAYRCAWALNIQFSGEFNQPWKQEQQLLPYFGAIVDAFHPIRPLLGSFVGWPYRIAIATEDLIEVMDGLAAYWGWEGLNLTKAGREAEIERRIEEHSTRIGDPLRVVALSWLALRPPLQPDLEAAEKYAKEGRKRGLQPETLELDEAIQRFLMLQGEWNAGLRIGKVYPRLPDETPDGFHLTRTLNRALTVLHGFLEKEGTSPLRPWRPEENMDPGPHAADPQPEHVAVDPPLAGSLTTPEDVIPTRPTTGRYFERMRPGPVRVTGHTGEATVVPGEELFRARGYGPLFSKQVPPNLKPPPMANSAADDLIDDPEKTLATIFEESGAAKAGALVRLLINRSFVTFEDAFDTVWEGRITEAEAVRNLVSRINKKAGEQRKPLAYKVASRKIWVIRDKQAR